MNINTEALTIINKSYKNTGEKQVSILSRITKLEATAGVVVVNVGNELKRLKALALSGKAPPPKTRAGYGLMIKD